jgi:hypothetical protein
MFSKSFIYLFPFLFTIILITVAYVMGYTLIALFASVFNYTVMYYIALENKVS